jgi:hypothetical protein
MSQLGTVADRILDAVHGAPGCELDDLVLSLPGLTWNQVFLEVDRLSRTGQVRVTATGAGTYGIWLPNKEKRTRAPHHLSRDAKRGEPLQVLFRDLRSPDRSRPPQPARR